MMNKLQVHRMVSLDHTGTQLGTLRIWASPLSSIILKKYILYIRIEHIYGVDWDFNRCI